MTGNTKIYILDYQNYQGEYFTEYYLSLKAALEQLTALANEAKQKDEYKCNGIDYLSFFDADYNSDSTFIALSDGTVKNLFQDWKDENE